MEEWRVIADFTNYEVSNTGKVRNKHTGRIIGGHITHKGYHQVGIFRDGKQMFRVVHRLVTEAFIGERPEKHEVNHKDGNKLNNHVDNLEYVTHRENMIHAHMELGNPGKKLNMLRANRIREMLKSGMTQKQISQQERITQSLVSRIKQNKSWIVNA